MRRFHSTLGLLLAAVALGCTGGEIGGSGTAGECGESDFVCGDGSCVPAAQQCNGSENCADGTDEDDCVTRCERTDYRCKDGNTCVSRGAVCDGRSDCPGGDDESTCAAKECDGFQCGDGTCIDPAAKCNGTSECAGGEDESAVTCAPVTCPNADDLRCTDGRTCVTKDQQCDGVRHCPRGEDEGVKMCADGSGDPDGDGKGSGGTDGNKPRPGGGGSGGGGKPGGGSQDRPCGDVPEAGVCKDDQLVWCDHGRLERTNCRDDGKSCGQNADGNNACLDTDGEPEIDCGEMPETGTCQGSTLMFCSESGEPRTEDCMAKGEQCVTDDTGARCAPAAGMCGDIDYQGQCNGQVVEWCNASGELETYDCALSGQACSYIDAETGYGCQAAPCGEVTYYGECSGDTLRYCADDTTLIEIDCRADYGVGCGLENDTIGYNCGGAGGDSSGGGCGDISYEGTCDGDVAVWCDEGALAQYDCSVQGKSCGYVDGEVGYWCVSPSGDSACGDIDYEGTCDGDWAVWCEDDQIQYADCSFDGGCGYVGDGAGYYCLGEGGGDGGGGSEVTSCDGLCGIGEVSGSDPVCYCDDACVENGDCCGGVIEYDAVCGYDEGGGGDTGEGSCYDWCGSDEPAPGSSCYCDDYCYDNGDCCPDIDYYCY